MERKKPIGLSSGRLFCFFTILIFAFFYAGYLARELWFDEVLTLHFAALPSLKEIYCSYTIPNNQIVHTCFIHLMLALGVPESFMRLFPLLCGAVIIRLLWKNFSRQIGRSQLAVVLAAGVISPPCLLYSSALRGYMLAALFTVLALISGKRYALSGRKIFLAGWLFFSLLTVGVMPSALAGIAAAGLYVIPYCGKKYWKNSRVYLLALAALAAPVLFYAPIYQDLLKAFELKEGWYDAGWAVLAVYFALIVTFAVPLAVSIFFHRPRWRDLPRTAIWLLPLGSMLLPVAPFPRVWTVMFPVFVLLAAGYLHRVPGKILKFAAPAVLLWGIVVCLPWVKNFFSPAVSVGGQDDFYAPRFVRPEFKPSETAEFTVKNFFHTGSPVWVSFEADPFAFNYAMAQAAGKYRVSMKVWPDVPPGKLRDLPDLTLCVTAAGEDKTVLGKRFQGVLEELYRNDLHQLYIFRKGAK